MKRDINCIFLKIVVLLLSASSSSFAQFNLVPNPGFEVYDTCPSYSSLLIEPYRAIYYAIPWFQANVNVSSTDYF